MAEAPNKDDLNLIDDRLEDEGKDDAALWDELEGEGAAPDDDDQPPGDQPGGEDDDTGAAADHLEGEDDGAATRGDGSDDAPDRGQAGGKPEKKAGETPTEDDPWAQAAPEVRAAHEAAQKDWENRDRRLRGQISALQRQLNDFIAKPSKPAAPGAAGKKGEDDAAGEGFLASDDWKTFSEEYPEIAGPLAKMVASQQEQLVHQGKILSAIGNERQQTALEEQESLLVAEHADWEDQTGSEDFVPWLQSQPRHIRDAALRNADSIVDAEEAADVISRFKAYKGIGKEQPGTTPDPKKTALADRRRRQLESSASPRSKGPGVASGIAEDGDEATIWKQFDEMDRRNARA